jgi:hypothetical protein
MDPKQLDKELGDLESALTTLKRDYEVFFSGGSKLPPLTSHNKLEKAIKQYSRTTELSYAQRFRYNNLTARFNSYVDLWTKQMRMREEGRTPSGGLVTTTTKSKETTRPLITESNLDRFQRVFNDYLKARQETGEGAPPLDFEKFSQQLAIQKEAIVKKYECKDVEFSVSIDSGHAKLKARPVK